MMFNTQGAQPLPIEKERNDVIANEEIVYSMLERLAKWTKSERKLIYLHGEIPSNKICLQAGQNLKISGEFLWKGIVNNGTQRET
ncbi:hypothetical protein CsatA_029556 [Cannabis sativa]